MENEKWRMKNAKCRIWHFAFSISHFPFLLIHPAAPHHFASVPEPLPLERCRNCSQRRPCVAFEPSPSARVPPT